MGKFASAFAAVSHTQVGSLRQIQPSACTVFCAHSHHIDSDFCVARCPGNQLQQGSSEGGEGKGSSSQLCDQINTQLVPTWLRCTTHGSTLLLTWLDSFSMPSQLNWHPGNQLQQGSSEGGSRGKRVKFPALRSNQHPTYPPLASPCNLCLCFARFHCAG